MESSAAQHKEEILRSENNLLQDELKQLREEVAILEENLDKSITEEEGSSAPSSAKHDVSTDHSWMTANDMTDRVEPG